MGEIFAALWAMASSTPIYMGVVGGGLVSILWQAAKNVRVARNELKEAERLEVVGTSKRRARDMAASNVPGWLERADGLLYKRVVGTLDSSTSATYDRMAQAALDIYAIPAGRAGLMKSVDRVEKRTKSEIRRDGYMDAFERNGIPVRGDFSRGRGR
jgi:hypothetical protein